MTVEQKEDENSAVIEYTKEQTCLDCKHCNQCYKQRRQGSNKACDDIELDDIELMKENKQMETRKSQYNKQGMYAGYKKNNKEREVLDYYSTPTDEVSHILKILNLDFENQIILEPHCGGGHMVQGILDYCPNATIYATDVIQRSNPFIEKQNGVHFNYGLNYDFLSDEYPLPDKPVDYIIMNPPYSTIEPNVMRALGIANKGVILLGRLQFLEAQGRYENIFKENPPTDVYVYVDRIACFKNGDLNIKPDSVQAYAWFVWDFIRKVPSPTLHWIRRLDKEK